MSLAGLRMRTVVARVVAVPFHLDDRTHVMGLLGFDFFADAVIHVDVDRGLAEAIVPEKFKPSADAGTVPIGLDDKTPAVRLRAASAVGRVVLDTGANRSVFEPEFADRADFGGSGGGLHLFGIGGEASAETAHVPSLELGGVLTRDVVADVSDADLGTDDIDGVLGTDVLHEYDLWFDYRTSAVYVRKSKR
jgi:hypothetical protein